MAAFNPQQIILSQINNGQEYNNGDGVDASAVNAAIEASAWAQETAATASDNASSAVSFASAANTKSDTAVETANSANAKSDQAVSTANTASETATNANSISHTASSTASEALAWSQSLTDAPDLSEANNIGTPSVSFVDNGPYKKFKFSNLRPNSIKDVDLVFNSETATETVYDVKTTLEDDTVVDSGQITIPKASIPVISEFAPEGQVAPSDDLMIGGFFFTEVS